MSVRKNNRLSDKIPRMFQLCDLVGEGEVAFGCPCSKLSPALLYTLQRWMRIIIPSTSPNQLLFYHGIEFMWASILRLAG